MKVMRQQPEIFTHRAMSSGSPKCPIGIWFSVASMAFSLIALTISVFIYPGQIAFTVMPFLAPSRAKDFVKPSSPAFAAE